eukprot:GDKI01032313.1.p1 GENE.GDKI01032313.1~~GDKI01032313.1.p1  ORF type:complete len:269 (-),score=39.12 GDKI01032313.1:18-824(-)
MSCLRVTRRLCGHVSSYVRNFSAAVAQAAASNDASSAIKTKTVEFERPYSKKIQSLVDELMSLSQEECDLLSKQCTERMTPKPSAPLKGGKKFTPQPVRGRVPFPHVAAIFGGMRAHVMPGVSPLQYMPNVVHAMMAHHQQAQMQAMFEQFAAAAANGQLQHAGAQAAPAAAPAETPAAETAAVQAESKAESKTEELKAVVNIKLTSVDVTKKINAIKEVRAVTALGLKEAKELVESIPKVAKKGIPRKEAEAIVAKLEAAGLTCVLE